ncbi:MAG: aminotransferase DegT [Legionellales bacterium RIFCSPHIGHO2_12_FULL_42_9]|nr:MAG: aminotransferase DegT [Legionellales bacterium RIFCSPHIGHO2_12_FULL_42_9]
MQFINLTRQYKFIETNILDGIAKVLASGQYIMGPDIDKLEEKLAEFVGIKHVIVNSSGTDSLLMALMALDIGPGDEVITTAFSFFASAEVIALVRATPVLIDIEPNTYNINPNQIEAAITSKTKAIMPVGLYGQMADMTAINAIADKYNLPVIEDAAQSFGAMHNGAYSCSISTIGCTSFFPPKPLGCYGDAGACFTNDDAIAEKMLAIRNHGQTARYNHRYIGINGRMDTIQAAILLEKIKIFSKEIDLRQQVALNYTNLLTGIVKTPEVLYNNRSVFAQYTIEVSKRDAFQRNMHDLGIPTAIHYPIAMHQQPALTYLGYQAGDFPCAELASQRVISLPMDPYLTIDEQRQVAQSVIKSLNL